METGFLPARRVPGRAHGLRVDRPLSLQPALLATPWGMAAGQAKHFEIYINISSSDIKKHRTPLGRENVTRWYCWSL